MAFIQKFKDAWTGPYSNKAGEFVYDRRIDDLKVDENGRIIQSHELFQMSMWWEDRDNWRVGAASKEGGQESGFVGVYLISDEEDQKGDWENRNVDTDVLTEEVVSGLQSPSRPFDPKLLTENPKQ
jgi:hypothetical protein